MRSDGERLAVVEAVAAAREEARAGAEREREKRR